jgi:FixJ family two-component response regulator
LVEVTLGWTRMARGPGDVCQFAVLLVEDDPATRAILAREAADAGHSVRTAADGHAAMEALAEQPAAIVLSDIVLPGGLDGVQLCRAVRAAHPDVEVILLSGFASIASAIEGVRLGASDYLVKPLERGAIASALAKAAARVSQRRAEREVVAGLRARTDGQAALLDRLTVPVVIADADARLLGSNRAAETLLAAGGALASGPDGRLRSARSSDTRELHVAIAASCVPGASEPTVVALDHPASRPRLRAVVAPLPAVGVNGPALAAILVDVPERSAVAPNADMLCRLYGLTRAEGQLAARLVAGDSVQEACEALGVALTTGRTHLSRVFAKTGTARQGDLIGLVLSGPALLATAGRGDR